MIFSHLICIFNQASLQNVLHCNGILFNHLYALIFRKNFNFNIMQHDSWLQSSHVSQLLIHVGLWWTLILGTTKKYQISQGIVFIMHMSCKRNCPFKLRFKLCIRSWILFFSQMICSNFKLGYIMILFECLHAFIYETNFVFPMISL